MPVTQILSKGRVEALLAGADLRYVRVDGVEVARRIFVTARDAAWDTAPVTELSTTVSEGAEAITVAARGQQRLGELAISWRVDAAIEADGRVRYALAATPLGAFEFNRIGLCVLHPPATCGGRPYRAGRGDREEDGLLPAAVSPTRLAAFDRLEIDGAGIGWCRFDLAGDLFELEDQRNWSDGSFKSYCTPLARPLPQRAAPGQRIEQSVELTVAATAPSRRRAAAVTELEIGAANGERLPALGLGSGAACEGAAGAALAALGPAHLRVDLRSPARFEAALEQARADCERLGCPALLAVHLGDPEPELAELAAALRGAAPPVATVLAFPRSQECTSPDLVAAARRALGEACPGARFGGGTDRWFVDLNAQRPDPAPLDALAWSITPQVHGDDELTMVEALAAQTDQARAARGFAAGTPLLVGPVTLRPRYNPNAPDAEAQALDPPPSSVDPRQGSPFAAAWTAASIAALAAGGVEEVTYFETVGPRGVLAAGAERLLPCGEVIAWAAARRGWELLATSCTQPLAAAALALRPPGGGAAAGLLVNLTASKRLVSLRPAPDTGLEGGRRELDPWAVVPI